MLLSFTHAVKWVKVVDFFGGGELLFSVSVNHLWASSFFLFYLQTLFAVPLLVSSLM